MLKNNYAREEEYQTVSVIVPNYNKAGYLDECLFSICSQSYSRLEIVIVDDGSQDDSTQIIRKYELRDKRIKAIYNKHEGKIASINTAYRNCSGEYIKLFGSDDIMHQDAIKYLYDQIRECDAVFHNTVVVSGPKQRRIFYPNKSVIKRMLVCDFAKCCSSFLSVPSGLYLWKREVAERIFPIPAGVEYEDWYIFLRLKRLDAKLAFADASCTDYVQSDNSVWGNVDNYEREILSYRYKRELSTLRWIEHNMEMNNAERETVLNTIRFLDYLISNRYNKALECVRSQQELKRLVIFLLSGAIPLNYLVKLFRS